ncbi:MAG: hypothetical protein HW394_1912 [Acidobacteria bacterium]|nr:hypothetical protein [Acidobacteriota bacterium]
MDLGKGRHWWEIFQTSHVWRPAVAALPDLIRAQDKLTALERSVNVTGTAQALQPGITGGIPWQP